MTAQASERIIIDGQMERMPFCPPLPNETYFQEDTPEDFSILRSSACWRGYVALWKIEDDKLYFVDIQGKHKLKDKTSIFADWFTGTLKIWKGKMVYYFHGGFDSIYEYDLYIEVENGVVKTQRTQDNTGKKWDWDAFWIYHHGCTMAESIAKRSATDFLFSNDLPGLTKKED